MSRCSWYTSNYYLLVSLLVVLASHSCGVLNCSRLKRSYIAIYHMDTSYQELSIGLGLGPGPGPGPSSSPTELNIRPSRITQEKSKRCYYKPKVQWSENMKIALAIIVSQEKRNGKGWMSRVEARWKSYFPMYDMLNMKNLRDRHTKYTKKHFREMHPAPPAHVLFFAQVEKCRVKIKSADKCRSIYSK